MSTQSHVRNSMQGVIEYYIQHPDHAFSQDKEAVAVVEEGLRTRATGPDGQSLVCDMPTALGGGATAPSPGWTMRAALANCEPVMIALRAAQLGVELSALEVRVGSTSDDRGMLGMDDAIPAGPLAMKVSIRIGATGVPAETLYEIVDWAEKHSPVGEPLTRVMATTYAVEIVKGLLAGASSAVDVEVADARISAVIQAHEIPAWRRASGRVRARLGCHPARRGRHARRYCWLHGAVGGDDDRHDAAGGVALRHGGALPHALRFAAASTTILLPGGLIAKREEHYSSKTLRVNANGFNFSYPGRTVIAMQNVWRGP